MVWISFGTFSTMVSNAFLSFISVLHTLATLYATKEASDFLGMFVVILQFTDCYLQLMITVGLCLDGGRSITNRFFSTKVMQVGDLSHRVPQLD